MAAYSYELAVGGLSGEVYITKKKKTKTHTMSDDRELVPKHKFIACVLQWAKSQLSEGDDTVFITHAGNVIAEIKIKEFTE